ncbi:tyrosine--tRNA ligase [Sandaracinus amylolyticus]|uniref:tyrosine--tRNA ligase n=1 Tax=Sandaracinus amylolyticus TaxID=927083 RepID=UPI001F00EF18|nr:tyrosine--tRNA ligase [Sandaracinus amylolyticus]UJR79279.1 Tyrosyl-tRNA synthetase [Sandaracinus amylolyticus]
MATLSAEEQLRVLVRGSVDLVSEADLKARLEESVRTGRPLKIKAGFDPTRPDLHLGHTVLMTKMRQFQELGHEVIFVVGDFTAAIGDPSGKNKTRPPLSREEIEHGAKTYAEQAFKVLDETRTRIEHNSGWLGAMQFADVIRLAGKYTLARMMERQDFKMRWENESSISLHELLYPLAQAYDSVQLQADVELGGTDQLFNLMVGRDLMKEYGLRPQVVMTTPILEGTNARFEDGRIVGDKMSKSLDNYVGVSEAPEEMLGKLMSIGDEVMWRYYELLSAESTATIAERRSDCANGRMNPRDAKMALAKELVARFHTPADAERVHAAWDKQFSQRQVPDSMPEHESAGAPLALVQALVIAKLASSNSDARRKIEQGAVDVDEQRVKDTKAVLEAGRHVLRAGRHYAAITVR